MVCTSVIMVVVDVQSITLNVESGYVLKQFFVSTFTSSVVAVRQESRNVQG